MCTYAEELLAALALVSLEFAHALGGRLVLEHPREAVFFAWTILLRPVGEVPLADALELTNVLLSHRVIRVFTQRIEEFIIKVQT